MLPAPQFKRRLCAAPLAFSLWAGSALAQPSASPPASAPPAPAAASETSGEPQTTVRVVAPAQGYRSAIDSRSYSLSDDLQASTGSVSEALRHVPAVQVDVDGAVSLRGDPSVTILVDGKPSALFSGPGRTQALQSMPAGQFERVEVMTNPPAGVSAEGGGGVINLISKKAPKGGAQPTASATLKADVGTDNRFDLGANGAYAAKGVSLTAGADVQRSGFQRAVGSNYELPEGTNGALVPAFAVQDQTERDDFLTVYGSAGLDLDPRDRLDAGLNLFAGHAVRGQEASYETGPGAPALDYDAPGFFHGHFTSLSGSLGLTHAFPGEGRSLSVKVTLSQNRDIEQNGAAYAYAAPAPSDLYQNLVQTISAPELDLKVDTKTPLPNKAKLSLGYEGVFDWRRLDDQGLDGPSAPLAVVDPAFAQTFTMDRRIQAIYGDYEQTLGRLTVQPGLRLESTSLQTDLVSAAERGRQDYFEAYPSLHLDYALTDAADIKASYGRRTQRPDEAQLDPFLVEASTTLYAAGNPALRPAFTQSYELGFEYRKRTTDVQATLFYRDKTDLLTTVTKDLGDEVLLSTWANLGHEHDAGLELVGAYTFWRTLSLNASTDLMRAETAAANLGVTGVRSAFIASGKITLNWQASPKDDLQLAGDASGRQLTAQGYRGGAIFSDFGWRHRFDARLALVLTAEDPFGLSRRALVIDTPTLIDVEKRKFNPTAVFFGFTYAFGATADRPGTFAFETPGHGPQ